ncbi:yellow-emperor [Haematobia irritans]|uniref:yellow-emperor n=1 Tax=Haematobia irritans TaxID=7368 RepID=UPI003F4F8BF1
MALRMSINNVSNKALKPMILTKAIVRNRSNLTPIAGWFEKPKSLLFHPTNILKHAEVIPIGLITLIGFTCEVLYTIRTAFTRDDVRFLNKKMACEQVETREGPLYPAPIRKWRVYNQKYEVPKGLIEAIRPPIS